MQKGISNTSKLLVFVVLMSISSTHSTIAQTTMGMTASVGLGAFVSTDKDYYGGISTDIYPELGGQINISIIRLGLKAGLIYRKYTYTGYTTVFNYSGYYGSSYYWQAYDITLKKIFIPVQGELLVAPSIGSGDLVFSPYVGGMIGQYIAAGDNKKNLFAISFKLGGEILLGGVFATYGDIRYTIAKDEGMDAGGIMIVVGAGIRI